MHIDNLNLVGGSIPESPNPGHLLILVALGAVMIGTHYAKKLIDASFEKANCDNPKRKRKEKVGSAAPDD